MTRHDMDEIEMFSVNRPAAPPYPPGAKAAARSRLVVAAQGAAPFWRRLPRPNRRLVLAGGLAVTLAAGITVAQTVGLTGKQLGPAPASAADVLHRAAAAARASKEPAPRPNQYVYVESNTTYVATTISKNDVRSHLYRTNRQIWKSADGTRPGLLGIQGLAPLPLPGQPPPAKENYEDVGKWEWTQLSTCGRKPTINYPSYTFLAKLPTEPAKLRAYIDKHGEGGGKGQGADAQAWRTIGDMLQESLVPPKLRAALFDVAAAIKGVTRVPDAKDAAGRHGVAVAFVAGDEQEQLIFDKKTYALLGVHGVLAKDRKEGGRVIPAGTVTASTADLKREVVDRPPHKPGASKDSCPEVENG